MTTNNPALEKALIAYDDVRDDYLRALRDKGILFAEAGFDDARIARLRDRLHERGADFRNAGASISTGWLSHACVECTGNHGSETFSTTLECHRDCYFCFNHNLQDYDTYAREGCPWETGLQESTRMFDNLACIGLTGGEPLLNLDDSIRFLERAGQLYPEAHKRMYTSGDLLTETGAVRLRDAGLDEIRFSVKIEDTDTLQEHVISNMAMAARFIPDTVVEMPIIPGTEAKMKELFKRFAESGIKGINMLEFCFPFNNWNEFARRGFTVRNPPFPIMYDYGYSGGLPISGSEELCLELMLFGLEEDVPFGMHYCSLENKHRSEIRQMNERASKLPACFELDEGDFFIKTAKVFGCDREPARILLANAGCDDFIEQDDEESLAFPQRFVHTLDTTDIIPVTAFCVLEDDEQGSYLREVGLIPYRMP